MGPTHIYQGEHLEYFEDSRKQVLYPVVLVYLTLFVVLGTLNFLAVQRESPSLLKWTTLALLLLQGAEISSHFLLGFLLPDEESTDAPEARMWHLRHGVPILLGSLIYFGTLGFYCRALDSGTLRKKKNFEIEDRYYDQPNKLPPKEKKRKKKMTKVEEEEEEEEMKMTVEKPSAPPPTPGPSQGEGEEGEPAFIDEDEEVVENVYVAGPDKKTMVNDT